MELAVIYFTDAGRKLAEKCSECMNDYEMIIKDGRCKNEDEQIKKEEREKRHLWIKEQFEKKVPLIFISACGIAVRMIAPFVENKLTDSPVLVMDDCGRYVIPILAGHVGGANELAWELEKGIKAQAIITTATDNHGMFAVDIFAKRNHMLIRNKEGIAKISSKVLNRETITIGFEENVEVLLGLDGSSMPEKFCLSSENMQPSETVQASETTQPSEPVHIWVGASPKPSLLWLTPKRYVLGMGCKKGKPAEDLISFASRICAEYRIAPESIRALCSIDLKKDEEGLISLAKTWQLPFETFSAEELKKVQGEFSESAFVEGVTGVGNVCERAALAYAKEKGNLLVKKTAMDGMTIAIVDLGLMIETWETGKR